MVGQSFVVQRLFLLRLPRGTYKAGFFVTLKEFTVDQCIRRNACPMNRRAVRQVPGGEAPCMLAFQEEMRAACKH